MVLSINASWSGPRNTVGQLHGRGMFTYADSSTAEGECVNGKQQGRWLRTRPDGTRLERQYVDDTIVSETVRHTPWNPSYSWENPSSRGAQLGKRLARVLSG